MNSAMFQLNSSIPVVTADGKGEVMGWIDSGKADDLLCIVNAVCRIYPTPKIPACQNEAVDRLAEVSAEKLRWFIGASVSGPDGNGRNLCQPATRGTVMSRNFKNQR